MSHVRAVIEGNPLARINVSDEIFLSQSLFNWMPGDSGIEALQQGDALISYSGNCRVVLKLEPNKDKKILFLTRSRNNEIGLEQALLCKIDRKRIFGVVRRRQGNPLIRFQDLANSMPTQSDLLNNVAVLSGCGPVGKKLNEELINNANLNLVTVQLGISAYGRIKTIGAYESDESLNIVGVQFNSTTSAPTKSAPTKSALRDYIENVLFFEDTQAPIRHKIIAACVFANTIANARNVAGLYFANSAPIEQ